MQELQSIHNKLAGNDTPAENRFSSDRRAFGRTDDVGTTIDLPATPGYTDSSITVADAAARPIATDGGERR